MTRVEQRKIEKLEVKTEYIKVPQQRWKNGQT